MSELVSKNRQKNIWEVDPALYNLIKMQKMKMRTGLELTASANFASLPVLQTLGSCLHNKNSECVPGKRHHGGSEIIDSIELLAQKRSLEAFNLSEEEWGCNVQPYSGTPANLAALLAAAPPSKNPNVRRPRVMGLHVPHGGHFTHGYERNGEKSGTNLFFDTMSYKVDPKTGLIDYEELGKLARTFQPDVLIAGVSCYSRVLDYQKFRKIADEIGAYLMADMAHIAGMVVAGLIPSPFDYADIVTSTVHKSLRGPRAGIIFYRKGFRKTLNETNDRKTLYNLEKPINSSVFHGLQGGAHNNTIAASATCMLYAKTAEFKQYQSQVLRNAKRLEIGLKERGFELCTGGTDIHLLLIDLRNKNLTGKMAEIILEEVGISCTKNHVPADLDQDEPSGIRIGTPALTSRGFTESDIDQVTNFIDKCLKVGQEVVKISGTSIFDFKNTIKTNLEIFTNLENLRNQIKEFSEKFPLPGFDDY